MADTVVPVQIPAVLFEGVPTSDGRTLAAGAIREPVLPMPLLFGPRIVGSIEALDRVSGAEAGTQVWVGIGYVAAEHADRVRGTRPEAVIKDVDWDTDGPDFISISGGTLSAVVLGQNPAWPDIPPISLLR